MVGMVALCAAVLSACASATAVPTEAATPAPTEAPTQVATATEAPTEAATAAPAPTSVTVNMATDPKLGPILVDDKGMTLYLYTKDTPGKSVCYDKCATFWPPLYITEDGTVTAGAGVTGKFTNIERDDGTYMVAYNGVALYYYQKDTKPGDVIGEGVQNVWHIVKP
jgi:predicted lipoprotein with Yx(FWY)xxD motif